MTVIDTTLVQKLITAQFPQWANLPIKPVEFSGWDNRTFHLGDQMTVRLPSSAAYAKHVEQEQFWLPKLAPHLPLAIPTPLAMGKPSEDYPWNWSVYSWIKGHTAKIDRIEDMRQFATQLADFLVSLQKCNATNGPISGPHNFYRGGDLANYDAETQQAIAILGDQIDANTVKELWSAALASKWNRAPVWVHGDVAVGNLLVENGQLTAVIDFGQLSIGDPACDLVIAWTFFNGESREAFRARMNLDDATWARARGWALWKALFVCAGLPGADPKQVENSKKVLLEVLGD